MKTFTAVAAVAAILLPLCRGGEAVAGPAGPASSGGSDCPFNYPPMLNDTASRNGLVFTVASNNPATNNRAVQLRTNPFSVGLYFVGVDGHSPVLLANLRAAALYSQARDMMNQLYDVGPTGYLNLRDTTNGTSRYTFGFGNATIWPGSVDADWTLLGGSEDGTYGLYHDVPDSVTHGFLLCRADVDVDHGPWQQLFYQEYSVGSPADFSDCESVGLRTTVAATIMNGNCSIGGGGDGVD